MKQKGIRKVFFALEAAVLLLIGAGCSKEDENMLPLMKAEYASLSVGVVHGNFIKADETKNSNTESLPLWAKSGLFLMPGVAVEGVFDSSRNIIQLSCEQENGQVTLYIDGEAKLSVPDDRKLLLYDMDEEDAFLELLVGNLVTAAPENGAEKLFWRITAYRIHSKELKEISLLPSWGDNSFLVGEWDWNNLSLSANPLYCYVYDSAGSTYISQKFQLMPEGYFAVYEEDLSAIIVDKEVLLLPKSQVAISRRAGIGIAFDEVDAMASTAHYNVYYSVDGGICCSLVMKDFKATVAPLEHIYILDKNTIICSFGLNGVSPNSECYASMDGGLTWEHITEIEETKQYEFLIKSYENW